MDFLRKKLEEVEGEMHATTGGAPSDSMASSWLTRASAAASELQQPCGMHAPHSSMHNVTPWID